MTEKTVKFEDDKMVIKTRHNLNPALRYARTLRDAGAGQTGENRLIGAIPTPLITAWLKEAGVSWHDHEAAAEVVKRKILSGEFDKFRVWGGTY